MTTMPLSIFTKSKEDSWFTPKWIFDALDIQFSLDVACPPEGPLHTPCDTYYTEKENGLTSEWHGTVWMNPPYSEPLPWVEKFINHHDGIAILPTTNGKWHRLLWESDASWLHLLPVKFENNAGTARAAFPTRLWLIAFGEKCVTALHNSKLGKVR